LEHPIDPRLLLYAALQLSILKIFLIALFQFGRGKREGSGGMGRGTGVGEGRAWGWETVATVV